MIEIFKSYRWGSRERNKNTVVFTLIPFKSHFPIIRSMFLWRNILLLFGLLFPVKWFWLPFGFSESLLVFKSGNYPLKVKQPIRPLPFTGTFLMPLLWHWPEYVWNPSEGSSTLLYNQASYLSLLFISYISVCISPQLSSETITSTGGR